MLPNIVISRQQEGGFWNLAVIGRNWKHCPWRVYAGARETLEGLFLDRLYLGPRRPDATQLRADAKEGPGLAEM